LPENRRIHRQDVVSSRELISPDFNHCGFVGVLFARDFDSGLYLASVAAEI
jgi:hypothetical protein